MKTLSALKKDLEFNKGLAALLEALKTIAVSQYRALEQKIKTYEKFLVAIESFFEFIDTQRVDHPFLKPGTKPQAVVAITSDSGLLGGLNIDVINLALLELNKIPGKLIVIGERGKLYAQESGVSFVAFSGIKEEERYAQAMQLRDYLIAKALEGVFGYLKVIYPRPISFTVQRVEVVNFLPFAPSHKEYATPASGIDVILESSLQDTVEYLVYLWMGQKIYEIFGLSRLAEFAARYIHLEESSQKLKELDTKTRLEYFRVRHELIDRNMRELFAARLLYAA
ncbi:MAG: F0F1 ATP synthase subunit gamma [Candidatus Omnitrophica bacterium]|nr:F0F1 ATP synthase subunit gamma [Candidatus Omnitrophota bacterium]